MTGPFEALFEAFGEYFAILVGLVAGAIAHVGAHLQGDEPVRWRHVIGFAMQLGVIGLIAAVATRMAGITDNDMRALASAILSVSANEVIQWLKRNGWLPFIRNLGAPGADREPERKDR